MTAAARKQEEPKEDTIAVLHLQRLPKGSEIWVPKGSIIRLPEGATLADIRIESEAGENLLTSTSSAAITVDAPANGNKPTDDDKNAAALAKEKESLRQWLGIQPWAWSVDKTKLCTGLLPNGKYNVLLVSAFAKGKTHAQAMAHAAEHEIAGVQCNLLSKESGSIYTIIPKNYISLPSDEYSRNWRRWLELNDVSLPAYPWLRESVTISAGVLDTGDGDLDYIYKLSKGSACPAAELSGAIFRKIQFENQKAA